MSTSTLQLEQELVPSTIINVVQNMKLFLGHMIELFEISLQNSIYLQDTQFNHIRLQTCQLAMLYKNMILPFGHRVLQDSSKYFTTFIDTYQEFDSMKALIEDVCDDKDILMLKAGFEICNKIH